MDTTVSSANVSTSAAGAIDIDETDGITLTDVDTSDGDIDVVAGGTIVATDVASLTDDALNDISLLTTGGGDIELGVVTAGVLGDVTLDADGSIEEIAGDAGADDIDVQGALLTLSAETGIGATLSPELSAATGLSIDNATSGDVAVRVIGDVTLSGAIGNVGGGSLSIEAVNGDLDTGAGGLTTDGGDISLSATDTDGTAVTLTVSSAIGSSGGDISLESADHVVLSSTVDGNTT